MAVQTVRNHVAETHKRVWRNLTKDHQRLELLQTQKQIKINVKVVEINKGNQIQVAELNVLCLYVVSGPLISYIVDKRANFPFKRKSQKQTVGQHEKLAQSEVTGFVCLGKSYGEIRSTLQVGFLNMSGQELCDFSVRSLCANCNRYFSDWPFFIDNPCAEFYETPTKFA